MSRTKPIILASARVDWTSTVNLNPILSALDDELEELAAQVEAYAKTSAAFADQTGKLRGSISRKPHPSGHGWVVEARARHAFLVEYGHDMISRDGRKVGRVDAHSFLRAALDRAVVERAAIQSFSDLGVLAA